MNYFNFKEFHSNSDATKTQNIMAMHLFLHYKITESYLKE